MAVQSKPIPALYVVYILRSTRRLASLYIGSTPNPPRRLNQHNGKVKGGAARTAKDNLRPWEMVAVVSGFPSMVGALKFEWALNNPHVSLHIAPEDRLTVSTQRKRNGAPRRPVHRMASILPNLHLLLRVPSFSRWPLKLHFFDEEVYGKWGAHCVTADVGPLRRTLEVVTDFKPTAVEDLMTKTKPDSIFEDGLSDSDDDDAAEVDAGQDEQSAGPSWGIHALPLDHSALAPYLEKGQDITTFEREGACVICREQLDHDGGLYAICPSVGCEGVGHLDCWSRHLLREQGEDGDDTVVLPTEGGCPECGVAVRWGDMMKELTLRTRGQQEVDKLLRKSRRAVGVTKAKAKAKATTAKVTTKSGAKAKAQAKSTSKGKDKGKGKAKATSAEEDE